MIHQRQSTEHSHDSLPLTGSSWSNRIRTMNNQKFRLPTTKVVLVALVALWLYTSMISHAVLDNHPIDEHLKPLHSVADFLEKSQTVHEERLIAENSHLVAEAEKHSRKKQESNEWEPEEENVSNVDEEEGIFSNEEATELCSQVSSQDKSQCVADVMSMLDKEAAHDYVQLLRKDEEWIQARREDSHEDAGATTTVTVEQAKQVCAKVVEDDFEKCVDDVVEMNDLTVAQHYVELLREEEADISLNYGDGHDVTPREAAIACIYAVDRDECIHDVLAINALEVVAAHTTFQPNPKIQIHGMTEEQAKEACVPIHELDQHICMEDMMVLNSPEVAQHYVKLLKESEANGDGVISNVMHLKEAEHFCKPVLEKHMAKCIRDVMATNDRKVALKFVNLLEEEEGLEESKNAAPNDLLEGEKPLALELAEEEVAGHDGLVTAKAAAIACSMVIDKEACVHDVLAMDDLEVAEHYDKQHQEIHHQRHGGISKEDAAMACTPIADVDKVKCVRDVMKMKDSKVAAHYVHLLQDAEISAGQLVTAGIAREEAEDSFCFNVFHLHQEKCIQDVMAMKNRHVAEHYVQLLEKQEAGVASDAVSEMEAEQTCSHVASADHDQCVKDVQAMGGKEAAEHYLTLLELHEAARPRLTQSDATSVCIKLKTQKERDDCIRDVMTMNDIDVAKDYAELLRIVHNAHASQ